MLSPTDPELLKPIGNLLQHLNKQVLVLRLPPLLPFPIDELLLPSDKELIDKYGDAQGNILIGHGRQNVTCLFVSFADKPKCQAWLKSLLPVPNLPLPLTTAHITTAAQQLLDRALFNKSKQDAGLFTSLLLTSAGCDLLQVPIDQRPQEAPDQASFGRNDAYQSGMRAAKTTALLQDPQLTQWDGGWHAGSQPTPIHALLLLADSNAARLDTAVQAQQTQIKQAGGTVQVQEKGARLIENGHDIEHFGYADGVSQPIFVKEGSEPHPVRSPLDFKLGPEELVLVPDKLAPGAAKSWGSFLVFRKLNQQVPEFKAAEEALADTLKLPKDDRERAGAMLVGRFEDGTPVVLQATDGKTPMTNNFDYKGDPDGLRCPFHAHIRKTNPRLESVKPGAQSDELRHRITRRGVPYGTQADAQQHKPAGLLFMCYQRNIGKQFEFMQQQWADNAGFPFNHGTVGLDPIIGQGARPALKFPTAWGQPGTQPASFAQFVTLKGGEYFYAPSLTGLAHLAGVLA